MKPWFLLHALSLILVFSASMNAQIRNVQINQPTSTTPEEVSIAINPLHPANLVAGANIRFAYHSTDGGYTWAEQQLTSTYGVWGDPCLIYDALGNAYYAHLSNPPADGYWIDRIVVQKSTDEGLTWNAGAGIGYNPPLKNQDKEWLAADMTSSPYRNFIYSAWTEFDSYGSTSPVDSSRILFARSTDGGLSWSSPVRVSDHGGNCVDSDSTVEGAVPAIGPNGEVYLSWGGPLGIMFDKSTDGGATFGADVFVTTQPGGWDFDIPGIYRANGMPVTACDRSTSPYHGNVYIQWSDQRNGPDNTDIFFIKSTDGGQTWGSVKQVNNDASGRQQFFSWMTVDQTNGNIYVVFYDRRNTIGVATEVYVAASYDGGETFRNFKASTTPAFSPTSSVFFGDYINIAAQNGLIYPIWMRLDGKVLSVLTAIIHDGTRVNVPSDSGWQLTSVPVTLDDYRVDTVLPSRQTAVYGYWGSYMLADTLQNGPGYWVKIGVSDTIRMNGAPRLLDSIRVRAKWNLFGSISVPVAVNSITSDPPGMTISPFYEYTRLGGYHVADTIRPGQAYWVKASQEGRLILAAPSPGVMASAPGRVSATPVTILADGELPPPPPTGNERPSMPASFALAQNYPNPFNPETRIEYSLPSRGHVLLRVFNLIGQQVATLVNSVQDPGTKSVQFSAGSLPSGVYIYQITSGTFNETRKMIIAR